MRKTDQLSDADRHRTQAVIDELFERCEELYGVLVSTVDGHSVLEAFKKDIPGNKLSAMTSSMLALGETIAKESSQRQCRYVIVESSEGYVLTRRLGKRLVLTTMAGSPTNLGMLHSISLSGAEQLAWLSETP